MFWTILIFLLLVATVALVVVGKRDFEDGNSTIQVNFRLLSLIPFGLALITLFFTTVTLVDSGTVGVPKTFGKYGETVLTEGVNFTAPWTSVVSVDIKNQDYTMSATSNEGKREGNDSIAITSLDQLTIPTDVTILYAINKDSAPTLLRTIGEDYENKIVRPNARQIVRDRAAEFNSIDLVTSQRAEFAAAVQTELSRALEKFGIEVVSINIRDMTLPPKLQEAVTTKATEAQLAEQKLAELRKAQLQADITRTNAQATADSQQIVACGGVSEVVTDDSGQNKTIVIPNRGTNCDQTQLTPAFLQSEYIKALRELVDSPNNSTLILPTDSNLTPLINVPSPTPGG